MKLVLLLLVVFASIAAKVDSAMVVSSSTYYHQQITTTKEVFRNSSKIIRKFHKGPSEELHNTLRDVAFRDEKNFGKCEMQGEVYSAGAHTLPGCRGLQCSSNGVAVLNTCPNGLHIEGGNCDGGVPLHPLAPYPNCCERKYTCFILA